MLSAELSTSDSQSANHSRPEMILQGPLNLGKRDKLAPRIINYLESNDELYAIQRLAALSSIGPIM